MRYCTACKSTYPPQTLTCPTDRIPTVELSSAFAHDPFLGKSVGSYQVIEQIGAGGMGVVYKAKHSTLGRFGAVKFLLVDSTTNPQLSERFLAEAKLLSRLEHPNIVGIYDFGILERRPYYIMEYLEGESLSRRIKEHKKLPLEESIEITLQLLDALKVAHAENIVHRDIKPDNLILTKKKEKVFVKLLDFGIAKILNEDKGLTQNGAIMGTPAYLSPEQAQGETTQIDPRTDLYSVGAMLFEMSCGRLPFMGQNLAMMLLAHVSQTPPLARSIEPSLPASFEAVLAKSLQKEKRARYQSAQEMSRDLERVRAELWDHQTLVDDSPAMEDPALKELLSSLRAGAQVPLPSAPKASTQAPPSGGRLLVPVQPPKMTSFEEPATMRLPEQSDTLRLEEAIEPHKNFSQSFGRHYLYEYLPEENILHVNYQGTRLEDTSVVDSLWRDLLALLDKHGRCYLLLCFDSLEFGPAGAEEITNSLLPLLPKLRGLSCYTTHFHPRFIILNERIQKKLQGHLSLTKDVALQELRKQAGKG